MSSYKDRLTNEFEALSDKIDKLEVFLLTKTSKSLDSGSRSTMKRQVVAMKEYRQCLMIRLAKEVV